MQRLLDIAQALSDLTRVRALVALRDGELCLCHLIGLLKLAPSTVSKHLDLLVRAGLVERRKEGRWAYFRLNEGTRPRGVGGRGSGRAAARQEARPPEARRRIAHSDRAGRGAPPVVRHALRWVFETLVDDPTIARDAKRLAALRCCDPKELAACYKS